MLTIFSGLFGILLAWLTTIGANADIVNYTSYDFKLFLDISTMIKIILFCGVIGSLFGIYQL